MTSHTPERRYNFLKIKKCLSIKNIEYIEMTETILDGLDDILVRTGKYANKKELFNDALRALLRTKPEMRKEVAIYLYKNRKISLSRGAEICGVNIEDFKEILKERGIKIEIPSIPSNEIDREVEAILNL
jgi:predicted HTH domain antitoxin